MRIDLGSAVSQSRMCLTDTVEKVKSSAALQICQAQAADQPCSSVAKLIGLYIVAINECWFRWRQARA
jgi:hypothetical protein